MAWQREQAVRQGEKEVDRQRERRGRDTEAERKTQGWRKEETGERNAHRDAQKREPGEAEKQQKPDAQAARGGSIHRGKEGPS